MAKKKSILDIDEPVVVEDEEKVIEPIDVEAEIGKAEETAVVKKENNKKTKAETQTKAEEKKKRGVKICVF